MFRLERSQRSRLETASAALERAAEETQAVFDFSLRADQLSRAEELVTEAVELAVKTVKTNWGLGILSDENSAPQIFLYPPQASSVSPEIAVLVESARRKEDLHILASPQNDGRAWAAERFDVGKRSSGFIAVGMLPGRDLAPAAPAFLKALTGPLSNSLRRTRLISSLRRINRETLRTFEFDRELNSILQYVTEDLQMEFGTVTLKDDYRGMVETIRGRNVPPGLMRLSRYPIGAKDIQTHVIETGETLILDSNHELFNQEIFEFFEHHKLARIWVPIRAANEIIGTIEAGCAKDRKDSLLTEANRRSLERFAEEKGPILRELRPQSLLSLIAAEAIELVNADSASIHVFQCAEPLSNKRLESISQEGLAAHFRFDEAVLAAGAGKAGPAFIQAHPPRPHGIGWEAILASLRQESDTYRVLDEARAVETRAPEIHGAGVRAILAIALHVAPDTVGMLYVHYWKPHRFTPQEIQLERVFAAQIEVAIQGHLLLRSTASAVHESRTLLEWLSVIQAPATLNESFSVFEELAQKLLLVADGDNVVLYPYVSDRKEFLSPILKGKFLDLPTMRTDVGPPHLVYTLLQEDLPAFYSDITTDKPELAAAPLHASQQRFVIRERIRSCAVLELRARPGDELFGLLFVNYRARRHFTPEDKKTMQVLAASAAIAIRAARFYEWLERRQQHIDSLREIDTVIAKSARSLNAGAILTAILAEATLISDAWGGAVLMRTTSNELEARATEPPSAPFSCPIGIGAIGRCAESAMPCYVAKVGVTDGPTVRPESRSCVAIPLLDGATVLGVLFLESDREGAFSDDDVRMLQTLAIQAVIALHTIDDRRDLELERRRAEALSLVARRIQNAEYSIDLVLYFILTGITTGRSLGFSRAMLFERDEHKPVLRGRCAIGEVNEKRAKTAWENLGDHSVEQALDSAHEYFNRMRVEPDPLYEAVRSMEIPLVESEGVIARCVLNRSQQFCSIEYQPDPFQIRLAAETKVDFDRIPFACVPLVGRREIIGALVVDNRFQPGELEPISDSTISRVTAYAELAAMSIEAARLMEMTQTHTYEDLAHQLRRPIALAAEYCRDLRQSQQAGERPADPSLLNLNAAIERAVHVSQRLQHYADLAHGRPLDTKIVRVAAEKVVDLIKSSVRDFEVLGDKTRGLVFDVRERSFQTLGDVPIDTDLSLLKEALENLLDNAVKYSFKDTHIVIAGEFPGDPRGFELFVENTGLGIKENEIDSLPAVVGEGLKASMSQERGRALAFGLWTGL